MSPNYPYMAKIFPIPLYIFGNLLYPKSQNHAIDSLQNTDVEVLLKSVSVRHPVRYFELVLLRLFAIREYALLLSIQETH